MQSGRGPTVVLVHGVAGSHRIFDLVVPLLEREFTVVRVDLLGYGHSPKPRAAYTPDVHVEAIHDGLAAHGVVGRFALVGLSMGVNLVLAYAARWPEDVSGIVGVGFPYFPTAPAARRGLQENLFTKLAIERPVLASVAVPVAWFVGRHLSPVARRMTTIYTPEMAREAMMCRYLAFRRSLVNTMIENRLEGVLGASGDRRRLFIHGGSDQWCSVDQVRVALAPYGESHLEVIDGAPHNVVVTEPARTAALIADHLRE